MIKGSSKEEATLMKMQPSQLRKPLKTNMFFQNAAILWEKGILPNEAAAEAEGSPSRLGCLTRNN
jgi:hypothetical protein